jgi:transcriptional regulator with XRE-family HTH domain
MNEIRVLRQHAGMTQAALARAGGTSQPTVAAYEAGQKSPTLTTLRRLAGSVGLDAFVAFHSPMTREDRRSVAVHRAIASHLVAEPGAALARARQTLRKMRAHTGSPSRYLREWELILDRPVPSIVEVMMDPSPWARELRHVTPFAGVLTPEERTAIYRDFGQHEQATHP